VIPVGGKCAFHCCGGLRSHRMQHLSISQLEFERERVRERARITLTQSDTRALAEEHTR
jgi:hypothetical protein